jgi:predicted MFS family arabinose efflux permease
MNTTLQSANPAVRAAPARAWLAVASVALGTFAMVTSEFLPIGLLGAIARDMGVGEGRAGLMVTVPGFTAAFAAPAAAVLTGRLDRRMLLLVLSALILGSNLLVAGADSFGMLLAGRVLLGLCVGGFWAFAAAVGRRLVPLASGDRATAIVLTGISSGTVLGVPLATTIGNSLGWRGAFVVVALLALLTGLAQLMLLPCLPGGESASLRTLPALLRNRVLATGLGVAALVAGGHFAAYTYLEPFLAQAAGFGGATVSLALAAYGVAGIAGTLAGERLAARGLRFAFAAVGMLLAVAIGGLAFAGAHGWPAGLLVTLWGLAFGAAPVCVQLWVFRAVPRQAETSAALMVTVFQLALAAGASGGGWLIDHAGLHAAYGAGALTALLAALLLVSSRAPAGVPPGS